MFVRVIVDRLGFPNEERESMFVRGIVDRLGFPNEEREHVCSRDCRLIGIHERRERGTKNSHVQKRSRSKEVFLRQVIISLHKLATQQTMPVAYRHTTRATRRIPCLFEGLSIDWKTIGECGLLFTIRPMVFSNQMAPNKTVASKTA